MQQRVWPSTIELGFNFTDVLLVIEIISKVDWIKAPFLFPGALISIGP